MVGPAVGAPGAVGVPGGVPPDVVVGEGAGPPTGPEPLSETEPVQASRALLIAAITPHNPTCFMRLTSQRPGRSTSMLSIA